MNEASLPMAVDSERALLCCLTLRPTLLDEAGLSEELFYVPAHRMIYRHFVEVYIERSTLDFFTVKESFRLADFAEIGKVEYLAGIYELMPFSEAWRSYRETLVDRHIRRQTILACNKLRQQMFDLYVDYKGSIQETAEKALLSMVTKSHDLSEVYLDEGLDRQIAAIESQQSVAYIELSDIRSLNLALGGAMPGEQLVIAAETSFGKTTLAINIATHVALGTQKKKVALFSFEMSRQEIWMRILSSCVEVPLSALRYNQINTDQYQRIVQWKSATVPKKQRSIDVEEGYALDITEIISKCRRLKAKEALDMVIVDYLQLVNPAITKEANRQREVADISRRLKVMAGELELVVIALSQLNDDGRLRESRAIGQDADVVLIIEEAPNSDDAFERTIRIEKNRNGPRGAKVPVHFYGDYVKFTDKQ